MKMLQKIRSFVAFMFVAGILAAVSLTSCDSKGSGDKATEDTEHPAGDSAEHADHPKGEAEHPKSDADTTKVVN